MTKMTVMMNTGVDLKCWCMLMAQMVNADGWCKEVNINLK